MQTPAILRSPLPGPCGLTGEWHGVAGAAGLVLLVQPRHATATGAQEHELAEVLRSHGLATLRMALPEPAGDRGRSGIVPLAARLLQVLAWLRSEPALGPLALGVLASGEAACAALRAAARRPALVQALVARSAPIEQAGAVLGRLRTPVLFVVGGLDAERLASHRAALPALRCMSRLEAVPGTNGSFGQPGALQTLAHLAGDWFARELAAGRSW